MNEQRLLLLGTEFPPGPGGIGTHAYHLAVELGRLGWRVTAVTAQDYVSDEEREAFNRDVPFEVRTLRPTAARRWRPVPDYRMTRRAVRETRPHVMVASGSHALWLASPIARSARLPWLAVVHGSELLARSWWRRRLTRKAMHAATGVVAVSRYTQRLLDEAGICPRSLAVIPNGADETRFQIRTDVAPLRRELGLEGRRILLTVGNVSERKAQDVVIRALPGILERHPDVVYVVAGLPTREPELTRLAAELGVSDHVRFAGVVPDEALADYYNLCDLFVLVSREARDGDVEGYGIVVVEAALCGKTSVVSRHGGLTEAVHNGDAGVVVPPESPEATAEAIVALLSDDERRARLALRALKLAQQSTWTHRVAAYDTLLRGMVPA